MDDAKRAQIQACGRCGQPEDAHKYPVSEDPELIAVVAALGGACEAYVVSDASVIVQKYLAITSHRAPQRRGGTGRLGKRLPLHQACGFRHHPSSCPLEDSPGTPGPDTLARGLAKAREALSRRPGQEGTP